MKITEPTVTTFRDKFRVTWWQDGKRYAVVFPDKKIAKLNAATIKLAIAGATKWPSELLKRPAVQRYLVASSKIRQAKSGDILQEYLDVIAGNITPEWMGTTKAYLSEFNSKFKDLPTVTVTEAERYISEIGQRQSVETRNKKMLVLKKFYTWATRVHLWPENPFIAIKKLKHVKVNADIHYLARQERDQVLAAALKHKHGLAVWISCYAGMRRGEVWNLKWEDFNFNSETVIVQSKSCPLRTVPLASELIKKLQKHRKKSGLLFECESYKAQARSLVQRLRNDCPDVPSECINWNPFRHTFCSLLVQDGVSLDKVATWIGDSINTCKKYYARFTPKNKKDKDIDRL